MLSLLGDKFLTISLVVQDVEGISLSTKSEGTEQTQPSMGGLKPCFLCFSVFLAFYSLW